MNGGYISHYTNAHVWGRLEAEFSETSNCLKFSGVDRKEASVDLFNLFLSSETSDCIEQLGVIIDACQDAIILLHSKQLESETLGTQPDSPKVNDAVEAAALAQADDNEVPF